MSHPPAETPEPPVTGETTVDAITAGLGDLDDDPLAEQHDRLAWAHEQLHAELSRDSGSTTGVG